MGSFIDAASENVKSFWKLNFEKAPVWGREGPAALICAVVQGSHTQEMMSIHNGMPRTKASRDMGYHTHR
jgi:hypothetical protein